MEQTPEKEFKIVKFSNEMNAIFENAAILLMLVDKDGRIVNMNRTGLEMTGKEKADILGSLGGEIFNCVNAWSNGLPVCGIGKNCGKCRVRNLVNDSFLNKRNHYKKEGILSVVHDNQQIELNLLISTSVVNANQQDYVLITIDDITTLKRQEKELNDLIATKDLLFSIIAHDLKSPMFSMIGFSDHLLKNLDLYTNDKIENQLKIINRSSKQIFYLLEDLLIWTKLQTGRLNYAPGIVSISQAGLDLIELMKVQAEAKGITVTYFESDEIYVYADLYMLKTILRNLISNAIKFTEPGGHVNVYGEKEKDYATITVSDNGIGIDEESMKNFWDLSQKFINKGTTGEKGGGLGLLLCKEFVEKHRGKIWVESVLNKGSEFKFTIPLA